jgi:hypothetical protein
MARIEPFLIWALVMSVVAVAVAAVATSTLAAAMTRVLRKR